MPDPRWVFKPQQPGDTTRDPISGEFFATEAIRNSAEALIREGIQNSLDAGESEGTVRVRIRLSGEAEAAGPAASAEFLAGLDAHLLAPGNGIRPDHRPDIAAPCRHLVFEDFGTRGLEGDVEQWHKVDGVRNKFYAFFRAEGESDKSDTDRRGRWGVGKFVFPRASLGSTFFGVTVRANDRRRLLLGRSILKSHPVGDIRHVPDGYFGNVRQLAGGRLVVPVEDAAMVDRFCLTFGLNRTTEPGLSLVVPWYDPEITAERLLEAAVRDWFFSVQAGDLEVEVAGPEQSWSLNAGSLEGIVNSLATEARRELEPLLTLSGFALSADGRVPVRLEAADTINAPKWHDEMLTQEVAAGLRGELDAMRPIAVRVPVTVRPKGATTRESHLDLFVMRDSTADDGRPIFVREGVIVTDAKGGRARGFRSIVNAADPPLAELLGDAENPSHTEWRADTANFKDRYKFGPGYLTFVKQSVAELMVRLQATEDDTAPDLLLDLFSLPKEEEESQRPGPEERVSGEGPEPPPPPPPPPRPKSYQLQKREGGFTVKRGSQEAAAPSELEITVAYDVRRGNPFRKYDPADFQLLAPPVVLGEAPKGLARLDSSGNMIRLKVLEPDFSVTIIGFDTRRDLIVRVVAKGTLNDNAAA